MAKSLSFGTFLAPYHPLGENPLLSMQRDLENIAYCDELGFDEAWIGEHHSAAWETVSDPAVFLAAAGERTTRIRLGSGVVSLPYHHPLMVADRFVQLDYLTRGRAMLGVGPGALDAPPVSCGRQGWKRTWRAQRRSEGGPREEGRPEGVTQTLTIVRPSARKWWLLSSGWGRTKCILSSGRGSRFCGGRQGRTLVI